MSATTLIPLEEYLATSYPDGDREYLDGQVVERTMGESFHARIQSLIFAYFYLHYKQYWSAVETRVRISARRFRIPDVCLVTGAWPAPGPLTEPPFLVIEVLSPDDRVGDLEEKIDDYFSCGVKYVWVINPATRRGTVYTTGGSQPVKDGVLRTEDPSIEMPPSELFS